MLRSFYCQYTIGSFSPIVRGREMGKEESTNVWVGRHDIKCRFDLG